MIEYSKVGIEFNGATKVKKQGIRSWDEKKFWYEIIYKKFIIRTLANLATEVSQM